MSQLLFLISQGTATVFYRWTNVQCSVVKFLQRMQNRLSHSKHKWASLFRNAVSLLYRRIDGTYCVAAENDTYDI